MSPASRLLLLALLTAHVPACGVGGDVSVGGNRLRGGALPSAGAGPSALAGAGGNTLLPGAAGSGGDSALGMGGHSARAADAFVDSVGINTHFGRPTSLYGTERDSIVLPALAELGVRHLRESASPDVVAQLSGIGLGTLMAYRGHPIDEAVVLAKALGSQLEAVEGPSDSDFMPETFSYQGQQFPEGTRAYQADLFAAFQSEPALQLVPMALPTVYAAANAAVLGPLQSGTHCNVHSRELVAATPRKDAEQLVQQARVICGDARPMLATSVAYSTLDGHAAALSEEVAAKYSLRSLLAYFSLGVQRVYLYELINEEPDLVGEVSRHRGLLRADGSRKPAFGALANLLALLADPGGPLQASALSYALQGEIADVQQLLLQKRDGSFQLLLWQEVASWDQAAQQPLVVPEVSVTLVLESAAQTIDVFRPLASSVSEASHASTAQVLVSVPDHPVVVSIVP